MKRFLLFLFFCSQINYTQAQILFAQDFENGMEPMKVIDLDQQTPDANVDRYFGKWTVGSPSGGNGTQIAAQSSWYSPPGASDDWMITPSINISDAYTSLFWEAMSPSPDFRDGYEVWVSTSNDSIPSFTDKIFSTSAEKTDWTKHAISLEDYVGKDIFIAFRNNSNDKLVLYLDNIEISIPIPNDAAIETVDYGCASPPGEKNIAITIYNPGANAINSFELILEMNGIEIGRDSFSDLNIDLGNNYEHSFPNILFEEGPDQNLIVRLNNVNETDDSNISNNEYAASFNIVNPTPNITLTDTKDREQDLHKELKNGKAIIIDFFASWCSPCEASTPALNSFYVNNGKGEDQLNVFGLTVEPSDSKGVVNGLGWGATYPKFKYYQQNEDMYVHYARDLCLNEEGGIPFFVMICPNPADPSNSTVIKSDVGFFNNMFSRDYQALFEQCMVKLTDVKELESAVEQFVLSPNPTTDVLNIALHLKEQKDLQLHIFNAQGQVIQEIDLGAVIGNSQHSINTTNLANGIYWLGLNHENTFLSRKFVVQR